MTMKYTMNNTIRQSALKSKNVKTFLEFVVENFVEFDQTKKSSLLLTI